MYVLVLILGIFMFSSAYENLALRKPAWQSSTHNSTVSGPEKAVDGSKTDLSYTGQKCSVSADKRRNATWWVNLTDIVSIDYIVIYYRTDNVAWVPSNQYTGRFMGFYVYISNTTNKEDGHLCFHDRNYTRGTIPAVANITCPFHGQYVIYYNERPVRDSYTTGPSTYAFIELSEVEVYGCSSPRRYGSDCSEVCPTNCKEYCNIESGNCLQCFPGYRGDRCDQVCENDYYGDNCNQTCGYCKDDKTCHPTNGTCSEGCAAGFQGLLCNTECAAGFHGENCLLTCGKCKSSSKCSPINGTCEYGCIAGYGGLLCNEENMAYNRQTWQSSSFEANVGSSKAVDGQKTIFTHTGYQCSISANAQTQAAWWVNLTEIRSIRNVIIYYRTDDIIWDENNGYTARFMGFYLYVSNTTNIENGYLCFHDTNYTRATIPAVANISCPVHGQYVIYYNERPIKNDNRTEPSVNAHSELCEVEVYGCSSPRHYGRDCSKPCPNNCIDFCHINSGSCNLCTPGFKGSQCEQECDSGFHGESCSFRCGYCKRTNECHNINGTCLIGCAAGYEGEFCNKTCRDGYFGENCVQKCSDKCKGCNRTNGICENGCHPGWQGDFCHLACSEGYFGSNCLHKCNDTCKGCNGRDGVCENGCLPGWKGLYCHEECNGGFYGNDCGMICGNCLNFEQCHPNNGTCLNGCDLGYEGAFCNKTCKDGTFGHNCHATCNDACYGCNSTNGKCEIGCHPGWKGDYCNEECINGFYGKNCSKTCGFCKRKEDCQPINGMCLNGCIAGYEGQTCNKTCSEGYFGEGCVQKCSDACKGCNRMNGICENGCQAGWKGKFCSDKCLNNFYGEGCNVSCGQCLNGKQCHHINGSCQSTCAPGYSGNKCDEACRFGYFGDKCARECSLYCKESRDCHHVSGICRGGCKKGWQGDDCMKDVKVMQITDSVGDLRTQFYSAFGVCCFLFFLIGIFVLYKMIRRLREVHCSKTVSASTSSSVGKNAKTTSIPMVKNDNYKDEYQELGDLCSPSNYDMLK